MFHTQFLVCWFLGNILASQAMLMLACWLSLPGYQSRLAEYNYFSGSSILTPINFTPHHFTWPRWPWLWQNWLNDEIVHSESIYFSLGIQDDLPHWLSNLYFWDWILENCIFRVMMIYFKLKHTHTLAKCTFIK